MGVLYVVDSVTRQWIDQARKSSQLPGSGAPDGTYAAGVTRVTELLPVLMNDLINSAPEDQKVRFTKAMIYDFFHEWKAEVASTLVEALRPYYMILACFILFRVLNDPPLTCCDLF